MSYVRDPEQFRATLRQRLRAPLDPEDERAGMTPVDTAVMLTVGAVAGGVHVLGMEVALTQDRPAAIAAAELRTYLREALAVEYQRGYDEAGELAYAEGFAAGEARLDDHLEQNT